MPIQNLLEPFPEFKLIGTAESLEAGIDLVITSRPKLIFYRAENISKVENLTGELFKLFKNPPKLICILDEITHQLPPEVFQLISYPFKEVEFVRTILKFERQFSDSDWATKASNYTANTNSIAVQEQPVENADSRDLVVKDAEAVRPEKPLTICVKSYGDYRFIEASDITYLKADNNSTDIHLNNGEMITAFKTLKHFETVLQSPFVRIHNSYIVNIDYVSRIHTGNSVCYLKQSGIKLPFSKSYKENIDSILDNITRGNYLEI